MSTQIPALTDITDANLQATVVIIKDQNRGLGDTVAGSSNGFLGTMDGIDRWFLPTDAGPGAWLVLNKVGGGQEMISHLNAGPVEWQVVKSPASLFSGGSPGVPPTAGDQTVDTLAFLRFVG